VYIHMDTKCKGMLMGKNTNRCTISQVYRHFICVIISCINEYTHSYTPKYTQQRRTTLPSTVQKGNVCTSSWMDRKVVTAMSTATQPEMGTVLGRQKHGTRITVPCPLSIMDFNQFMGGIDRGDQICGYYSCRTKCYKYIYYFCLMSPSRMPTSSKRATVAVFYAPPSKRSGCSWQWSSLVTTAVDEGSVVVLSFIVSLSATIPRPSQKKIPQEGQA
jgi:hypothetical protein